MRWHEKGIVKKMKMQIKKIEATLQYVRSLTFLK